MCMESLIDPTIFRFQVNDTSFPQPPIGQVYTYSQPVDRVVATLKYENEMSFKSVELKSEDINDSVFWHA